MTEDKDLERARELFVIADTWAAGNISAQMTIENFKSSIREERRRLLNDPRIKALIKRVQDSTCVFCAEGDHLICEAGRFERKCGCFASENMVKDFESLLKENTNNDQK